MDVALRAVFNLRNERAAHRRVFALIDAAAAVDPSEFVRMLKPWSAWLTVEGVREVHVPLQPGLLDLWATTACETVLLVSDRAEIERSVAAECRRRGLRVVTSAMPPADTREMGLMHEVSHHETALSGFNEWVKEPFKDAANIVQALSLRNCRRLFPAYAVPFVDELWVARGGRPLDALDIGCGPISRLRWAALNGFMTVTGVDPLVDMYALLIERHGLGSLPAIRCARELAIGAEELLDYVAPASIDFAYSANAIDHAVDPPAIMARVAAALRPGGVFALDVTTREGTREQWWALHQWDMYVDQAGWFVCENRAGEVRSMVPPGMRVRHLACTQTTLVVLEREAAAAAAVA